MGEWISSKHRACCTVQAYMQSSSILPLRSQLRTLYMMQAVTTPPGTCCRSSRRQHSQFDLTINITLFFSLVVLIRVCGGFATYSELRAIILQRGWDVIHPNVGYILCRALWIKEMKLQRKALCLNLLCFGHFSTHGLLERHFIWVQTCLIYCADHKGTQTADFALFKFFCSIFYPHPYLVQAHSVLARCCAEQESRCQNKLFMFKAERRRVLVLWPWVLNYSETGFHAGWKCCREHAKQLNKALYGCFCSG